ncbi:DUF4913 domain-containing protein [Glutamicibacter sp. JL.03c]|uniref:DUF4913 domain-containing protein n=1 Tax=Glutamicibacter sp. JL.03c TaxID=2984842 RepID=UPI0021F7B288|nr:DUF4913 domain-containing protein [Glutamicibacter sp. JL.03c]UYQ77342.1 DUF4913 domain-containing protein [Glutamicibacter sp. JL.03c]
MIGMPPNDDELDLDGGEGSEPAPGPSAAGQEAEGRSFVYEDAEQWLHGYALPRYLRKQGPSGRAWAPNWYEYPEVYSVVTALWETWEQMRWDGPLQILVFYRDYFYPLMDRVTAQDGPFHEYDKVMHPELPGMFPVHQAPDGYFRSSV